MNLTELRELLTFLTFVVGAFKSTPEGRARRERLRQAKEEEKREKALTKALKRWGKARKKYADDLRKDLTEKRITAEEYIDLLADYDKAYPKPK